MGGCWPNYIRPLLETDVYYLFGLFYVVYVILVVFAVIRVITAIFLKETMDACTADHEIMVTERAHKREAYLAKLQRLFQASDTSGDGSIGEEEFLEMMADPDVKAVFSALELEVHEGMAIFQLLAAGDDEITYDEFITGVSRLKGQARAVDMIALQIDAQKMLKALHDLEKRMFPGGTTTKKVKVASSSSSKPSGEPTFAVPDGPAPDVCLESPAPPDEKPSTRMVW